MHYKKEAAPPAADMIGPRIMCLARLIRSTFNKAAADQGLFSGQQDIVLALVENEGITPGALAKKLDVSSATVSVSIKRMKKAGFIEKLHDSGDARTVRLYPTEKARRAPEKIREQMNSLDTEIKSGMSREQIEELSRLLDSAINNLTERDED